MDLIDALRAEIGAQYVLADDQAPPRYWADASGYPPTQPLAVVLPASTAEVAKVMAFCHAARQPVVVQGGLTGLTGGAHPQHGEIAVSTDRMNRIEEIDTVNQTMTVQAGATLLAVQDAAREAGMFYGVDLGARGSCTIGGNVATNAGGVQVLRYGMTRRQVAGMEAVLADGTVLSSLNKVVKNNTGYDWPQLIAGSEGTLALITRVCLRLLPPQKPLLTALCAVDSVDAALSIRSLLDRRFDGKLVTFEGMWRDYMLAGERWGLIAQPFERACEVTLLIEAAMGDGDEGRASFEAGLFEGMEQGLMQDALIARSEADRQRFWAYREANYEFSRYVPGEMHFDISVPISRMADAVEQVQRSATQDLPGGLAIIYGHLGDGNLHIAAYPATTGFDMGPFSGSIYELARKLSGSVSAEHGIGMQKRDYLRHTRSESEVAFMKSIKHVADPANILNRGRIFDAFC